MTGLYLTGQSFSDAPELKDGDDLLNPSKM